MMSEIGGFFQLELGEGEEYYGRALRLNSGRNALWYILKAMQPKKVHVPHYCCDSLLEPINREKTSTSFYGINERFEPLLESENVKPDDYVMYINYFGINDRRVRSLSAKFKNLIVDNAQAFFSEPIRGACTFYSPRKFFGVPDGGYLFIDRQWEEPLGIDVSYKNCEHLLKRIDLGAKESFRGYQKHEQSFSGKQIRIMSGLTRRLLSSIDYERVKKTRVNNFNFLHENLGGLNELDICLEASSVPMVYPFLSKKEGLRSFLFSKKIFVATYWKEVLEGGSENSIENRFADWLIPLPVDQRYDEEDMRVVVKTVLEFCGS